MSWTPIPPLFYSPQTVTVTIATPAVFTLTGHGLVANDMVMLTTTGALPTGLSVTTPYFVISAGLTANAFEVSATQGGAAIATTGTQSGTHTLTAECTGQDWQKLLTTNLAALMPVGAYSYMHASPTAVENLVNGCYLECNGTAVSRTTYSALFAAIGTTYGTGDGSTTFNLPDASGRLMVGAAGTGGHVDVNALADSDGAAKSSRSAGHLHSFTETAHAHTGNTGTSTGQSNDHTHNAPTVPIILSQVGNVLSGTSLTGTFQNQTSGTGTHTHSVSGLSVTSVSADVSVTPGGSQPVDAPAYICAGTLFIKAY